MAGEGQPDNNDTASLRTMSPVSSEPAQEVPSVQQESSKTLRLMLEKYSYRDKRSQQDGQVYSSTRSPTKSHKDSVTQSRKRKLRSEHKTTQQHSRRQRPRITESDACINREVTTNSSLSVSKGQRNEHSRSVANDKISSKPKSTSKVPENNLKDSLRRGLKLVMVGVNPGLTTALTGHAYAHASNRYWPTMFASGVTPIRHYPADTHSLMDLYGVGHTNIVERTTRTEAEIKPHEWPIGAAILDDKIRRLKPDGVAIVGKGIWKRWFEYKHGRRFRDSGKDKDLFDYGWQEENMRLGRTIDDAGNVVWPGAETIVVATTSGAAAQFAANGGSQRIALWKPLGEWFRPKREEWIKSRAVIEP